MVTGPWSTSGWDTLGELAVLWSRDRRGQVVFQRPARPRPRRPEAADGPTRRPDGVDARRVTRSERRASIGWRWSSAIPQCGGHLALTVFSGTRSVAAHGGCGSLTGRAIRPGGRYERPRPHDRAARFLGRGGLAIDRRHRSTRDDHRRAVLTSANDVTSSWSRFMGHLDLFDVGSIWCGRLGGHPEQHGAEVDGHEAAGSGAGWPSTVRGRAVSGRRSGADNLVLVVAVVVLGGCGVTC